MTLFSDGLFSLFLHLKFYWISLYLAIVSGKQCCSFVVILNLNTI